MSKLSNLLKKIDRNMILVGIAVVAVVVTGVLIYAKSNSGFVMPSIFGQSPMQIGQKAVDYVNSTGLASSKVSLESATEESGLVKIKIKVGTQEFDSYVTKDGKLLFAQSPITITGTGSKTTASANNNQTPPGPVQKAVSPAFEAYVVARCPYGLQMQRAMADAVKNLPALAQYLKVRYIGSVSGNKLVSMHGDAEGVENLRQICIREEQPTKYWNYVSCQMQTGDTAGCEKSTGVDSAKLNACTSDTSRGIAYAQKDFALDTKYNVTGSPTLILNGTQVDESSYGGRSSDGIKAMVCAGFNNQPSFCTQKLNTTEAAVSFSTTYAGSAANSGNSGATGTNCAPATPAQ